MSGMGDYFAAGYAIMETFDQDYIESLIHFSMKDRETLVRYYA